MRRLALATALLMVAAASCSSEPQRGGDPALRIAIRPVVSLDPVSLRDPSAVLVAKQIFEPLVRYDPSSLLLKPGLASRWQMHDGGSRWTFHLRPDAKFHDGNPVTAEDVRYSLNRLASRATASELAFLLDQVAGHDAVHGTGAAQELAGLTAPDARTVEFRLVAPWVDFPYVLTHPATAPVPRAAVEADPEGFKLKPIGNGPYRMTLPAAVGKDFAISSYPGYWGSAPAIRRVRFLIYGSLSEQWKDLNEGGLDIAEVPPGKLALARSKFGDEGLGPVAAGVFIGFNLKRQPDVRLRKAVSLAIDRNRIAHGVFEESMIPASGLVPEGLPGRVEDPCGTLCTKDVAGAKTLLSELFQGGPPGPLGFEYPAGSTNDAVARAVQADLAEVGLTLTLRPQELTSFFDTLDLETQELFRLGWVAEYPLSDWFLSPLYRSGSPDNHTGFSDPEIDALIAKARSETRRRQRLQIYQQIEKKMMEQMVLVPIGFFRSRLAAGPRVDRFYVDVLGGFEVYRFGEL